MSRLNSLAITTSVTVPAAAAHFEIEDELRAIGRSISRISCWTSVSWPFSCVSQCTKGTYPSVVTSMKPGPRFGESPHSRRQPRPRSARRCCSDRRPREAHNRQVERERRLGRRAGDGRCRARRTIELLVIIARHPSDGALPQQFAERSRGDGRTAPASCRRGGCTAAIASSSGKRSSWANGPVLAAEEAAGQ